jgi:hypothetical protein
MKAVLTVILLAALSTFAPAQTRHDPLTEREVDQLRDTAQEPPKRIEYLISYTRDRMLAIERLRSSTKPGPADADKIADLLGDVASLIDELDDNLTMYNRHSEDLRRPLRHVLDAETEFQKKLAELSDHATPLQKRRFATALADATDSLQSSVESTNAMLADQLQKKGEEKGKDKPDRAEVQPVPPQMQSTSPQMEPPVPPHGHQTTAGSPQEQ